MSRIAARQAALTSRDQRKVQVSVALVSSIPLPTASMADHVTTFSGQADFENGLQGSLTRLYNGNPFWIAGSNVTIVSESNGPVTISSQQPEGLAITGNDGEVQFNVSGNLGADPDFTYDSSTETLTVPHIRGRLTYVSDGVTPYLNVGGTLQASNVNGSITLSRSDYSPTGESSGPTPTWRSYTPPLQDGAGDLTLSNDSTIAGRYIFANNTLKLLFSLTAQNAQGALAGTGVYKITLPPGFEIDTDHVVIGSPTDQSEGLTLGVGTVQVDAVGGGGAWTVLPVSATQLSLWGKNPASSDIIPWGSDGIALTAGNDLRVAFTAYIPAIRLGSFAQDYEGPDVELDGGTFSAVKTGAFKVGTQFVEGALSFGAGTQIYLYESVFSLSGDYVLFDYSLGSFPGGQTELNNNVTVIAADLLLSRLNPAGGIAVLEDQPAQKRIILKLLSKPDNGKQWVEGDLVISGPTQLYLSNRLFTTAGTYELFEVTGTVSGIANLSVVHEYGSLTGTPFLDPSNNKIVKVTLA